MEPFSANLLTTLVLISVILSGATFLIVAILIICLLQSKLSKSRVKKQINDTDRSNESISTASRSASKTSSSIRTSFSPPPHRVSITPSVQSTVIELPATPKPKKRQTSEISGYKYQKNTMPPIEEYSSDDEPSYNHEDRHEIRNERKGVRSISQSSYYNKRKTSKTTGPVIVVPGTQFASRGTPYPPEIIKREKIMKAVRGFPLDTLDS